MKRYGFMKRIGLKNSHLLTSSDGGSNGSGGYGSKGKQQVGGEGAAAAA